MNTWIPAISTGKLISTQNLSFKSRLTWNCNKKTWILNKIIHNFRMYLKLLTLNTNGLLVLPSVLLETKPIVPPVGRLPLPKQHVILSFDLISWQMVYIQKLKRKSSPFDGATCFLLWVFLRLWLSGRFSTRCLVILG